MNKEVNALILSILIPMPVISIIVLFVDFMLWKRTNRKEPSNLAKATGAIGVSCLIVLACYGIGLLIYKIAIL